MLAAHSAVADHGLKQNIFIYFVPFAQYKYNKQQQPQSSTAIATKSSKTISKQTNTQTPKEIQKFDSRSYNNKIVK